MNGVSQRAAKLITAFAAFASCGALAEPLLTARLVAADTIDSRLKSAAAPAKSLCRFLDYNWPAANAMRFTKNPDFWAKDVDFSCASMWNVHEGNKRAGTAVSARHFVCANHYPVPVGAPIYFMGTDGKVNVRKVAAAKRVSATDLMVCSLDKDLPTTVRPAAVLPDDWRDYLGDGPLPAVTFDYEEKALVVEIVTIPPARKFAMMGARKPLDKRRAEFFENIIVGDSGNPTFLLMNSEPILLYTLFFGGAGSGPAVHTLRSMLQYEMDQLCPGYRLTIFDFAGHRKASSF